MYCWAAVPCSLLFSARAVYIFESFEFVDIKSTSLSILQHRSVLISMPINMKSGIAHLFSLTFPPWY